MATKETNTATVEQDHHATTPQTEAQIADTEKALGLQPPAAGKTAAIAPRPPVRMGVAPTNVEDGWRLAQFIAQSGLVPKGYQGRPADVLVAIQYGMEVNLPPMAALHSIFVTNGRPSLWGDGFLAVIMASGVYRDHEEYYMVDGKRQEFLVSTDLAKDNTTAVCTFWRADNPRPRTGTFSISQARKAGLLSKQGPWQEYPDRMLKMRARGFAGHDAFPDVLKGMRSAEETIDMPAADLPELEAAPIEPRRASEARANAVPFDPAIDHMHMCRGGHEYACAEKKCATTRALDCSEHAPATRPAASAAAAGGEPPDNGGTPRETRGLRITNTEYVRPKTGDPFFRITAQQLAGQEFSFVTKNEQAYQEAASFEGTDHLVAIGWAKRKGPDGIVLDVLEKLSIDETSAPLDMFDRR